MRENRLMFGAHSGVLMGTEDCPLEQVGVR